MDKKAEVMAWLIANGFTEKTVVVGHLTHLNYKILEDDLMIVTAITALASMNGDQVVEFDRTFPYAFIHVSEDKFENGAVIAVINKVDFANAWKVLQSGKLDNPEYCVFMRNKPASGVLKLINKMLPRFEFQICPMDESSPVTTMYGLETSVL